MKPPPRKREYFTAHVFADQVQRLRALSARTHVSQAEYVRQALDAFLEQQDAKEKLTALAESRRPPEART